MQRPAMSTSGQPRSPPAKLASLRFLIRSWPARPLNVLRSHGCIHFGSGLVGILRQRTSANNDEACRPESGSGHLSRFWQRTVRVGCRRQSRRKRAESRPPIGAAGSPRPRPKDKILDFRFFRVYMFTISSILDDGRGVSVRDQMPGIRDQIWGVGCGESGRGWKEGKSGKCILLFWQFRQLNQGGNPISCLLLYTYLEEPV